MNTDKQPFVSKFLNENSVSLLESQWSKLRSEAYCESAPEGWRIFLLGDGQVFVQAGFSNQETIEAENLLKFARTSEYKGLVERLLAIFEHIRK